MTFLSPILLLAAVAQTFAIPPAPPSAAPSSPAAMCLAPTAAPETFLPIDGAALTCCTQASGQQCCAQSVDAAGSPIGCGCAP
jgi:hypothetical protein